MSVRPNIWPRYSFVQDGSVGNAPDCYPDPKLCLPLSSFNNFSIQVQIDYTYVSAQISANPGCIHKVYLTPVDPSFPCSYDWYDMQDFTKESPTALKHHPAIWNVSGLYDLSAEPYAHVYFTTATDGNMDDVTTSNNTIEIPCGSCFKFAIIVDIYHESAGGALTLLFRNYFGCTNCFTRICTNECYTSVLKYTNADDAFDFHYSGPNVISPYNIVELPFYLRDPTMPTDQKIYTRSDGKNVVLYQRKDEQYILETDLIPYLWHKDLDIALSHDTVFISNANASSFDPLNTATQFVKKENYEIEYMKAPLSSFGKGSCKLLNADPIHLINNNCS